MTKIRGYTLFLIGILLSMFLLGVSIKGIDYAKLSSLISQANWWFAILLLLSLGSFYWIKAIRWRSLIAPIKEVSETKLFPAMMAGFAGNNLLPFHLGEFVRMYLLSRQLNLNKSAILATIALERCFDVWTIFLLAGVMLVFQKNAPDYLYTMGYFLSIASLGLLLFTIFFTMQTTHVIRLVEKITRFSPRWFQRRITEQLTAGATGLQALKSRRLLMSIAWTSIGQWFLMGLCVYWSLLAINIDAGLPASFFTLTLLVAGISLPNAPGYFGTIQFCFVFALKPYGVAVEDALAASVFYNILVFPAVTVTGLICIHYYGTNLFKLSRKSREA